MPKRDTQAIENFGGFLEEEPAYTQSKPTPWAQQPPPVVYMQPPQAQQSQAQEAAGWILLAFVSGFVMITLIAGAMMFL